MKDNLLRFERGKDFWTFTAEQEVDLEWRIFKDYPKALKAQEALLSYKPDHAPYLVNRLLLLRITQNRIHLQRQWLKPISKSATIPTALPLEYYKKGSFKVNERISANGVIEDFRYFRPRLFEGKKYSRFYVSDNGRIVGEHWASLQTSPAGQHTKTLAILQWRSNAVYPGFGYFVCGFFKPFRTSGQCIYRETFRRNPHGNGHLRATALLNDSLQLSAAS